MVYTVLSPFSLIFFWSCGYAVIVFLFCKQWYDWIFATVLHIRQRGSKDTERKPLGHLYLGVTHATMSSAVQNTEYTELQPLLSGVHSVMRVKSVLAGEGGGCTPTPSHYIYPHQ
jgi:hypothetical protein